jgi:gamma-glutamyltranspeptidase/glutathione hydrolase
LQLALERYGTRKLRDIIAPAIELADKGFPIGQGLAGALRSTAGLLRQDKASANLLLRGREAPKAGEQFQNPQLADLLRTFAEKNSLDDFYRGRIAQQIADASAGGGGLLTKKDLAAYRAREVEPIQLSWDNHRVFTAPLTAGGLTVLQALSVFRALNWQAMGNDRDKLFARVEALRQVWHDRLRLFGDPEKVEVPVRRLLSREYARELSERVRETVKSGHASSAESESRDHGGTVHLSAADRHGNMVALTLTHGNAFGARVTVPGLGLILGHGMSRFEPKLGHPNSVAPHKRPLHNMCPTIVTREGKLVLAIGGAGGRKIPNSVFDVLLNYLVVGKMIEEALAAPRLHTEGGMELTMEKNWTEEEASFAKGLGYKVQTGTGAVVSAVWRDGQTGQPQGRAR